MNANTVEGDKKKLLMRKTHVIITVTIQSLPGHESGGYALSHFGAMFWW